MLKLILAFIGVWGLGISALGCMNSPDFERLRNSTQPEAVLYRWFSDATAEVMSGNLRDWPSMEPCWFTIDSSGFDLDNDEAEEAFRSACAKLRAIAQKYKDIRQFREWSLESPLLRPPWQPFSRPGLRLLRTLGPPFDLGRLFQRDKRCHRPTS